jgi:OOP family OmpA-OmpF porin
MLQIHEEGKMSNKSHVNILMWVMMLLSLTACAVQQAPVEPIASTGNPGELVAQLDNQIVSGRKNQLNILSPVLFAKAEQNLLSAKQGLEKGYEISDILEQVAQARAQLKTATENAVIARTALGDAIKAREDARAAGATIFESDYADVEESFLDLTRAIENDNLKSAQRNQSRVVEELRALELRAIKEKTLGEVRTTLELAYREGAKKYAPELYAATNQELQEVDSFISSNPYEKEAMVKKASAVLFNAQRLLELTRQSIQLEDMKPLNVALWVEEMLSQMTSRLTAPDMRNQPFQTQVANIMGTIDSIQADRKWTSEQTKNHQEQVEMLINSHQSDIEALREKYESEITDLNNKIAVLEGKSREEREARQRLAEEKWATESRLAAEKQAAENRLEAERQFNQLYNEVQTSFAQDEAEVYKQGSQLVIRLSGIKFPVGKSIIMPENYTLLSKVQKAVRTFGNPVVVVEGHTDSSGSAATNEHLSQQRAEAVKEYLVANQTISAEQITAIGFGSIRPLASNATPEGRAINRRIDVIISPMVASN